MKKTVIILTTIFLAVLTLGLVLNMQQGLYLGDSFFTKWSTGNYSLNTENEVTVKKTDTGANFDVTIGGQDRSAQMILAGNGALFSYADGNTVQGNISGNDLVDDDGVPIAWSDGIIIRDDIVHLGKNSLASVLYKMYLGKYENQGAPNFLILYAFLYVYGAACFLYPEKMYFLGSRWMFRSAELSDEGLFMQKLGGVIAIVGAIIIAFVPLWI